MSFYVYLLFFCFFFFKHKPAYEMRISDGSSDVCSSDRGAAAADVGFRVQADGSVRSFGSGSPVTSIPGHPGTFGSGRGEIRAGSGGNVRPGPPGAGSTRLAMEKAEIPTMTDSLPARSDTDRPRLSIFGLGYVGSVSAGCFAARGHSVVGVDPQQSKVDLINQGAAPIIEEGLSDLLRRGVEAGQLRATTDPLDAILHSDVSMVCGGTQSRENGSLNVDTVVDRKSVV